MSEFFAQHTVTPGAPGDWSRNDQVRVPFKRFAARVTLRPKYRLFDRDAVSACLVGQGLVPPQICEVVNGSGPHMIGHERVATHRPEIR